MTIKLKSLGKQPLLQDKKKLARERNWYKHGIKGLMGLTMSLIKDDSGYHSERSTLAQIHNLLEQLLEDFKKYHPKRG